MKDSITNSARFIVAEKDGELFRASDLSELNNIHNVLKRLTENGEIEVDHEERFALNGRTGTRKVYRATPSLVMPWIKKIETHDVMDGWRKVWPEFFADPLFTGKSRTVREVA